METKLATKKDRAPATSGSKGVLGRVTSAIAESSWGPLAGKGALALVGFVALALVGSGRIGGSVRALGIAEAAAATATPSGSATVKAPPGPRASASAPGSASASAPGSAAAAASASAPGPSGTGPSADAGPPGEAQDTSSAPAVTADGKVAINRATEQDLRRLPGIGAKRAQAILELRARLGRFRRPEDLLRVKGIGRRKLARLRPLLILEP